MSNLTVTAFLLIQAQSCLATAVGQMTNQQRELDWANKMYTSCNRLNDIYTEIMNYVEGIETMDKQINKVKKDIQTNKKEKAVKDVNKLLKMDKKFDKKLDKCAKMSKKKGKR